MWSNDCPTWNGITRLTVSPTFLTRVWRRFLGSQILGRSVKEKDKIGLEVEPKCVCWSLRIRSRKNKKSHALSLWWSQVEPVWPEHWVLPCYGPSLWTAACLQWWDSSRSATSCRSDPRWRVSIHPLHPETQQSDVTEPERWGHQSLQFSVIIFWGI